MLSVWLRAIRLRFLLASVVAVSAGLAINWWQNHSIDIPAAALTMCGVLALHASVDLLNDYWDFRRGIDAATRRTKMSGGTGVLPEGLLRPEQVYRAGIAFLILGGVIGGYFIFTDGIAIAAILGFAILSIYFYSTRIVDSGLAEVFVAAKGALILVGAHLIQGGGITAESALAGAAVGALSSLVLFVTSFPDYTADRAGGRRTLVIVIGRQRASRVFWAFPAAAYGLILSGIAAGMFPAFVLVTLCAIPLLVKSGASLRIHHSDPEGLLAAMSGTLWFSRVTGALLVAGFLIPAFIYT